MSPLDRSRSDGGAPGGPTARLRLVPAGGEPLEAARADVARENHSAAGLADAHLCFARDVARGLDGGRAALLRPDARQRLLRLAAARGVRPFDAHLIIATVQDRARRGEPADAARPVIATLGRDDHAGPSGAEGRGGTATVARTVLAALAGAAVVMLALVWLIVSAG